MSIPAQQPAAQPAVTNDQKIGNFARDVLNEIVNDDRTDVLDPNPQEPQAPVEDALPEETPPEVPEPGAETPPQPEVPMVEVEVDGEKFTIPEKVKHRVMADKDYRQKTMEVAATKKQLEALTATAQKLNEQAQQMAPYHAQLFQMDSRAQALQQALQSPQLAQDPVEFNRVQGELAILLHHRGQLASGLQQQMYRFSQEQTALRQKQLEVDAPKLFEQFPELQKDEVRAKLGKYVQDEGLPQEAIDFLNYSAAGTKLVWKAHQFDQMVKDQAQAAAKLKEKVKTLPTATQSSRAAETGAKDKQLRAQWQKGGGKINDPNFDALLRSKLKG